MVSSVRLGVLVGLFPTLLFVGCGGKVGGDVDDSGTPDSASEVGIDSGPVIDVGPGPGGCGWGSCSPGMGCSDGCNSCKCVAENVWECTDRFCPDSGPPPPPPCPGIQPADRTYCPVVGQNCAYTNACGTTDYLDCVGLDGANHWMTKTDCTTATCPTYMPKPGSMCSGFNKCAYKNSCGGVDSAVCNGKYWDVAIGPCSGPSCPPSLPSASSPCTGPLTCSYANSCGSYDTAYCGGSSSTWLIARGDCMPPPPPVCPTSAPSDGSSCSSSGMSCNWNNGCGGISYGYCAGGRWSIKREPCSMTCPSSKPVSGAMCTTPGTTGCRYLVSPGSTCTTQCFCADDSRWACVTPPCAEPGAPPPSFDAGAP